VVPAAAAVLAVWPQHDVKTKQNWQQNPKNVLNK
jgi:hypothetical protein